MPEQQDPQAERYVKGLWSRFKERAQGIGETVGPGIGTKRLTADEEDLLWSTRALSVEQEWALWREGLSPEEIGLKVFPEREKLVKSGGRIEPQDWYRKASTLAQRAERKRTQQQPTEGDTDGLMV